MRYRSHPRIESAPAPPRQRSKPDPPRRRSAPPLPLSTSSPAPPFKHVRPTATEEAVAARCRRGRGRPRGRRRRGRCRFPRRPGRGPRAMTIVSLPPSAAITSAAAGADEGVVARRSDDRGGNAAAGRRRTDDAWSSRVALSLAATGSFWSPFTEAVLLIVPTWRGMTEMVTGRRAAVVDRWRNGSPPSSQAAFFPLRTHWPEVAVAETKSTPCGS